MSQGNQQDNRPEPPRAANEREFRWDLSAAATYSCDVANSTAGANEVLLNFGVKQRRGEAPAELSVQMVRRLALRPLTASYLRDALRNVIADIDADKPRGS